LTTRDVLRLRNFRLLFAGHGVSVFGDRMVTVALAFAVLELGGSASAVGLVLAASWLPAVASVLVGGVVADRMSRRTVMVAADAVRVGSQGAMAALLISGAAEVWMLAALAGVTGAATGFFNPAATGLLPDVVPSEGLQPANGLRSTAASVSEILGPVSAGLLVAAAGAGWAIAADAVTFAISGACLAALRLEKVAKREHTEFLRDLRDGWVAVRSRRWVWTMFLYFAVANLMWGAWTALGPVVADRELGGAGPWGTILAGVGIGALLGSLAATRVRPRRPLVFVALMDALFGLPLAFLAAGASVPLLTLGSVLSGIGLMLGMSVWETTLQREIPAESLSRVASYDWFTSYAVYPIGLAIWGPLAGVIGIHTALWLAFGIFFASVLALLSIPDIRRLAPLAVAGLAALAVLVMPAVADAKVVWLCKPGQRTNPCEPRLTTTTFSPTGKRLGVERVQRARRRRADCFYVYPTVSDQQRPQATQVVDDVLRSIALYQAARYSRDCRVFAPVYRQVTIQGLLNPGSVTAEMREQGYDDVVEAWRRYLKRFNHGRGVVLMGHSQGTFVLRRLIREEIDPKASERRRLVSAVLLGGNVTVRAGADRGGDFRRVRACRRPGQIGCVIAFSTFNAPVPENALFGRATEPNRQILCTNPAALGGGSAKLTPIYPSAPFAPSVIGAAANATLAGLPRPSTPWAAFPGSYSGRCSTAGGASVLQVRPLRGAFRFSPVPDATWGLHLTDANIALGQLADVVRRQIKAHD
jgi:MFS family permease